MNKCKSPDIIAGGVFLLTPNQAPYRYIYIMPLAPLEGQGHISITISYIEKPVMGLC